MQQALHDPRCKTCSHPRLLEVNERLNRGDATRAVAAWLKGLGAPLTVENLAKHRKNHLAVHETARAVLAQAQQAQVVVAVAQVVANVELLDELASVGMYMVNGLKHLKPDEMNMEQVALLGTCMREVRACVDTKHEILHGKKVKIDGQFTGVAALMAIAVEAANRRGPDRGASAVAGPGHLQPGGAGDRSLEPPAGPAESGGEPQQDGGA